jgi:acyl-CoA reductase-like NAD-dependent aldehyde dehydrogenase
MAESIAKNPADGSVIGSYRLDTSEDVLSKIRKAGEAQRIWALNSCKTRSACLKAVRDTLLDQAETVASTISRSTGKTLVDALATEIVPAVMAVDYYRKQAERFLKPVQSRGGNVFMFNKPSKIVRVPWGVVGIISPWNYPFGIPFSEVVMALLAGNAVVLKVASDTLAVGEAIAGLFSAAGLPENLFAYVNLPGSQAGPAFLSGGIDKLFFTGSTAVGKKLMVQASEKLTPLVLELGGNDAAVICADADLERSVAGIVWSGFSNAGQSCGGAQRILVQNSVYDDFLSLLKIKVEALRAGSPSDFNSDLSCMISHKQKQTVEAQISDCVKMGAVVFARSNLSPEQKKGCFVPATVLTNVTREMPVFRDEVFGPVVCIVPFETDDEAVTLANDSTFGLTSSVWSKDRKKAFRIAVRIKAGAIMINDHLMSHGLAETPWGGFGDSGVGRTHGEPGFMEMVRNHVIVDETIPGTKRDIWWHPYSEKVYRGLLALLSVLYSKNIFVKLKKIPSLLSLVFRFWEK